MATDIVSRTPQEIALTAGSSRRDAGAPQVRSVAETARYGAAPFLLNENPSGCVRGFLFALALEWIFLIGAFLVREAWRIFS